MVSQVYNGVAMCRDFEDFAYIFRNVKKVKRERAEPRSVLVNPLGLVESRLLLQVSRETQKIKDEKRKGVEQQQQQQQKRPKEGEGKEEE